MTRDYREHCLQFIRASLEHLLNLEPKNVVVEAVIEESLGELLVGKNEEEYSANEKNDEEPELDLNE